MGIETLGLNHGRWVVASCAKFPNKKNCQLVIMAPVEQQHDLIEAASAHAVKEHGHDDMPALWDDLLVTIDL